MTYLALMVTKIRLMMGTVPLETTCAFAAVTDSIAKCARSKNRMQMMISPTKFIQYQRDLRELEGI